jgi:receptor expression-enhancing protein 5/6
MIPSFVFSLAEVALQLYAGLMSFRAIQSEDAKDDKQWLTFWLLYTLFQTASIVTDVVGGVLPFYEEIKIGLFVFMGAFNGASRIYPVLEPLLLQADVVAKKYEAVAKAKINEQMGKKD